MVDVLDAIDIEMPAAFIDADLCLRLGDVGKRIVLDPYVEMRLGKGKRLTRSALSTEDEREKFRSRWKKVIDRDPFFNPNLSVKDASFSIDI